MTHSVGKFDGMTEGLSRQAVLLDMISDQKSLKVKSLLFYHDYGLVGAKNRGFPLFLFTKLN